MGRMTSVLAGLGLMASASAECAQQKFKSLVQFGDSYTDIARLGYFIAHNGSAPPVGWEQPESNSTSSGGYIWGHYVSESTGVNLYDYAVSGAVCSNKITPHYFALLGRNFPSVEEYEVPAFLADSHYITPSGDRFLDIPPDDTVYAMWIGTNDLGVFLKGKPTHGKTILDYIDCVYAALDQVYQRGARHFVLMNVIPLQLAPLYATPENGGVGPNLYWPDKPVDRMAEISYEMWAQVALANGLYRLQTPFEALVADRYPGASFALMDVHKLINDIYHNPAGYLDAPANVTGYINHCNVMGQSCTALPNPDSFLWFDPLHPSQRTHQIIAEKFVDVMQGQSEWATYYGEW